MTKASQDSLSLQALGGLSAEQFLSEYWQKKPLLIRDAFPDFRCPVSPDELAGLSMEAEVESRIVIEQGSQSPWELHNGPFEADKFSELPETHWTLLVQQLDAWVPEINALKSRFNFIPNWRIDDIMASYAPKGGSVGPHFDYYDVFLLQAQGHRHWQTGQMCDDNSAVLSDTELSILKEFENDQAWTLAPGDMLYLPPRLAHHGVAQDDCITLSIGFRAPNHEQLLDDFSHHIIHPKMAKRFYQDPPCNTLGAGDPGAIAPEAMQEINRILDHYLNAPETRCQWFVQFASRAINPETLGQPNPEFTSDALQQMIRENHDIHQNEGSRFVYLPYQDSIMLGVDGKAFKLSENELEGIQLLCRSQSFEAGKLLTTDDNHAMFQLVVTLIREGSLYC